MLEWNHRQGRQQIQQRLRGCRLDDQSRAVFPDDRMLTGQLEFARDPNRLIPAVLEHFYMSFGEHCKSAPQAYAWQMPKRDHVQLSAPPQLPARP